MLGQEVARVIDRAHQSAGFHEVRWNGRSGSGQSVASGVYIYNIVVIDDEQNVFNKTKRMMLLK